MIIKSLQISGYRSFGRTCEATFQSGFNCVIGPSGCGKSSFIKGLLWGLGVSLNDEKLYDLFFKGTSHLRPAKKIFVHSQLSKLRDMPDDIEIMRSVTTYQGHSQYRINDTLYERNTVPEIYSTITKEVIYIPDYNSLLSVSQNKPSQKIIISDNLDSKLSDNEMQSYSEIIRELCDTNQIIAVTQNKPVASLADHIFGITMLEYGISSIIQMQLTGN